MRDIGPGQLEEVVATHCSLDRNARREDEMTLTRLGAIGILCGVLCTSTLCAGDLSSYRGYQFGSTLAAAAKQAKMKPSDAVVVHQHPALVQELDLQSLWLFQVDSARPDPVEEIGLDFYNGELYQIVVTYDRYKVEGMTADDMIEGISQTYGAATKPTAEIAYHSDYGEVAPVIARWENSEYSGNLVRTGDQSSFALVLYSKRLYALAQAAIVQAVRLETQEAPQRELDQQKAQEEQQRLVLEKARSVNKPNFRP